MELITIIIPTFQPGKYLLDCLQSIDIQSLSCDRFKVVVILNGKKNPYYQQIGEWLSQMSFTSQLIYTEQKGVSNARNLGLQLCPDSKYAAFIDDDDYVSPNYLESLLQCANQHSQDSIICSDVRTFDEDGVVGTDYISRAYQFAKAHSERNTLFYRRSFLSSSCCKLIPRNVIGNRHFSPILRVGEDSLFMASISDRISNIALAENDAVYFRRIRRNSASRVKTSSFTKIREKWMQIWEYIKIYITGYPKYNTLFYLSRIIAVILK